MLLADATVDCPPAHRPTALERSVSHGSAHVYMSVKKEDAHYYVHGVARHYGLRQGLHRSHSLGPFTADNSIS